MGEKNPTVTVHRIGNLVYKYKSLVGKTMAETPVGRWEWIVMGWLAVVLLWYKDMEWRWWLRSGCSVEAVAAAAENCDGRFF